MPSKTKSHDKEIDSVLTRLHSGSRFIAYTERRGSSKPTDEDRVHNALQNLSPPDEVHAELGRALAFSYVTSLQLIEGCFVDEENVDSADVQAAVDRGMHIIESLVCGEEASTNDKQGNQQEKYDKRNYASVASSFFNHVIRLMFINDGTEKDDEIKQTPLLSFVKGQWHQWCIRCEELAYDQKNDRSFTGGGGNLVFNICLKGYASISYISGEFLSDNTGTLFRQMNQSSSRKLWIRLCVSKATELIKTVTSQPSNVLLECLSSDGVEVVNPRGSEIDKLWVDSLSPLFYQCVLRARHETPEEHTEASQEKHYDRQLLLHEILRGCSLFLRNVKDDGSSILNQTAHMLQYLSTSLHSYFGQVPMSFFARSHYMEIIEFAHDWLREICELTLILMSKSLCEKNNTIVDALGISCETILRYALPQISSIGINQTSFDNVSVYSSLVEIVSGLPKNILNKMADAKLSLSLGTLALSVSDDEEVDMLCNLLLRVFAFVEESNLSSSDMIWIGGVLYSLGNTLQPASINSIELKKLGDTLVQNGCTLSRKERMVMTDNKLDELLALFAQSYDVKSQNLISMMAWSISNVDDERVQINSWKRRPCSMNEQNAALLIGLSQLHIIRTSSTLIEDLQTSDPFTLLNALLTCHPRLSARVVPSLVDVARACITKASNGPTLQLLLRTIKFIASSAIVVDPNGAFIAWTFLSSFATDSNPPAVRTSILSLLPTMCASNKKLRSRIRSIIGKSLAST